MRRWIAALCSAVALVVAATGCGDSEQDTATGSLFLTVYTAGTLQGDGAQVAQDGTDAVKLALAQADGMAGQFTVNVVSLDDTDPDTGRWGAEQAVQNARRAIADRNIMAYISQSGSGATALTLPLLNEAGVLQLGPETGYVGLTRPAGRGEPERFYPSGVRSFGRIAPADDIQAQALVSVMHEAGVRRLAILHDGQLEGLGLADLVAKDAPRRGIEIALQDAVEEGSDGSDVAKDAAESGADAVFYAGTDTKAGTTVLDAVHAAAPSLRLFAPDGLARPAFAAAVAPGTARRLLLTSPAVPYAELGAQARRFAAAFQRAYHRRPLPDAVFSYEAMRAFLDAVRDAGPRGNDRAAIIASYFALRDLHTALGTWSVTPTGDSTLRRYAVWRVRDRHLAYVRDATPAT